MKEKESYIGLKNLGFLNIFKCDHINCDFIKCDHSYCYHFVYIINFSTVSFAFLVQTIERVCNGTDIIRLLLSAIGWPKEITLRIVLQAIEYYGRAGVTKSDPFGPEHF